VFDLKKDTAIDWPIFVHDVNGVGKTGLVTGDFTSRISKNGAAFGAMTVTITEMEGGWYKLALTSSHTDTLGALTVYTNATGAVQVNVQWRVQTRLSDDLTYPTTSGRSIDVDATGGVEITADQNVNVNKWLTVTPAALTTNGYVQAILLRWLTDNAGGTPNALISNRIDANAQVVGDKTGYALTSGEEDTIADKVWDEVRAGHVTAGTFGQGVASVTGAVGSVTGSVGSVAAGGITATSIATGAVDADALAVDALAAVASAVFAFVLEDSKTFAEFMRIILAALAGVSDGGTTTTIHFKARNGTTNRITATVDTATGNRTAIVLNGS
jgi:hypothetical protein